MLGLPWGETTWRQRDRCLRSPGFLSPQSGCQSPPEPHSGCTCMRVPDWDLPSWAQSNPRSFFYKDVGCGWFGAQQLITGGIGTVCIHSVTQHVPCPYGAHIQQKNLSDSLRPAFKPFCHLVSALLIEQSTPLKGLWMLCFNIWRRFSAFDSFVLHWKGWYTGLFFFFNGSFIYYYFGFQFPGF